MPDQGCGRDTIPNWVQRQLLAETRASKLKGNMERYQIGVFVYEILAVPGTNILIVNTKLTKIKTNVGINLK
jgi:hypothetical protein